MTGFVEAKPTFTTRGVYAAIALVAGLLALQVSVPFPYDGTQLFANVGVVAGDETQLEIGDATRGALSASDEIASVLRPGGELLGSPGVRPGIRTLTSRQALDDLFEKLSTRGVPTSSKYPGTGFDLPDGGFVGLRESARYGPTIDINIPGLDVFKYHLGG